MAYMNRKIVKKLTVAALFLVLTISAYAGGKKNEPDLVVSTPAEDARLIELDWSNVKSPEKNRFGLYRVNRSEKTYSLFQEVNPDIDYVLDENLNPPLTNYFYKIEIVSLKEDLLPVKPLRIKDSEMEAQLATAYYTGSDDSIITAPPIISSSRTSGYVDPRTVTTSVNLPLKDVNQKNNNQKLIKYERLNDGIYIGILSFSEKVNSITHNLDRSPCLIMLDASGRQLLLEQLNRGYVPSTYNGTALYYAEHYALANLLEMDKNGLLPLNVDSVSLITFTDGIDTSSTDANFVPLEGRSFKAANSGTSYRTFISSQIQNRKISKKPVEAWSIGIRGKDVISNNEFDLTLEALATDRDHITQLNSLGQIESCLASIADRLNVWTPQVAITFTTPAYPVGTLVRITFDNLAPDSSAYYIDARVAFKNEKYSLTNIAVEGIPNIDVKSVEGTRTNSGIEYLLTINNEFLENSVQQWYIQSGSEYSEWQPNSEFFINKSTAITHEKKSAIIYLVLDASTSLNAEQISNVRDAIGKFIDNLYTTISKPREITEIKNAAMRSKKPLRTPTQPPVQKQAPAPQVSVQSNTVPAQQVSVQSNAAPAQQVSVQSNAAPAQQNSIQVNAAPIQQNYRQPFPEGPQIPSGGGIVTKPNAKNETPIVGIYTVVPTSQFPPNYSQGITDAPRINSGKVASGYWIQIGSYREIAYAQKMWRTINESGCNKAEIFAGNVEGDMYYRVKVGPFSTREEADITLRSLRSASYVFYDCFISQE